jgi:hypothetical protein
VRDKLIRFELTDVIGERRFHPTVGSAVDDYERESGAATDEHGGASRRP